MPPSLDSEDSDREWIDLCLTALSGEVRESGEEIYSNRLT